MPGKLLPEAGTIAQEFRYHEALNGILRSIPPIALEKGDILLHQGQVSEAAYFLDHGSVEVYTETPYGAVPLATLQAPSLIGEIGVLARLPRTASVKAVSDATVYRIGRSTLLKLGRKAPSLLHSVIGQLGQQLEAVNKTIGLCTNALAALERRAFDSQILDDLTNPPPQLAAFAATFRRFASQILDKRRQHDEMASAAIIQQSLLPKDPASMAIDCGVDLHAEMRSARHVGGDFYDVFRLDPDHLAIAIGDVCGKGMPASLFMAVVVTVLRTVAREDVDVAATVARVNAALCRDNESSMFATVFYAVLNVRTGVLAYCNCGHVAPVHLPVGGEPGGLAVTGLPLGLFADRTPAVCSITLGEGDVLVLFTDGVTEAMSPHQAEYGDARFIEMLSGCRDLPAVQLASRIFAAVVEFAGEAEQADDITCITIRRGPGEMG